MYTETITNSCETCPVIEWLVLQANGDEISNFSFLTVDTSTGIITIRSVCDEDIGTYDLKLVAQYENFP